MTANSPSPTQEESDRARMGRLASKQTDVKKDEVAVEKKEPEVVTTTTRMSTSETPRPTYRNRALKSDVEKTDDK